MLLASQPEIILKPPYIVMGYKHHLFRGEKVGYQYKSYCTIGELYFSHQKYIYIYETRSRIEMTIEKKKFKNMLRYISCYNLNFRQIRLV
ncbi:hypothetical protein KUTeg_023333, partial [Tegillarca granosa]